MRNKKLENLPLSLNSWKLKTWKKIFVIQRAAKDGRDRMLLHEEYRYLNEIILKQNCMHSLFRKMNLLLDSTGANDRCFYSIF